MLINAITKKKCEVPRDVLMQFSIAIILGKIDYASLVYASAKKTIFAKLNTEWNETLRRTTNALKSTPIPVHKEKNTYGKINIKENGNRTRRHYQKRDHNGPIPHGIQI